MGKVYKQILPLKTDEKVKDQFGWLPVSVYKPTKGKEWKELIKDDGDVTTRRSKDCKYLPKLKFSEFNPDLAEKIITYWSLKDHLIVDPFAGRATRGVISLHLGRKYEGYEVAPTTYKNTKEKVGKLGGYLFNLDGCKMELTEDGTANLVFTCPPYHRLEKYESADDQLSDIKDYDKFLEKIELCIKNIHRVLDDNGFVCWVCGDWRDGKQYRTFHIDCINKFRKNGFKLWDVVIIENISPFAPLQAGKVAAKRYTSKVHEYLLVFRKEE